MVLGQDRMPGRGSKSNKPLNDSFHDLVHNILRIIYSDIDCRSLGCISGF